MQSQQDTEWLVINKSSKSGVAVVHRVDCGAIRHQVEQDVREELPSRDFTRIGQDATGAPLYRESTRWDTYRYEASYITRDELLHADLGCRPCRVCNPDIPSHSQVKPIAIHAVDLKDRHLGKFFFGWGVLERFVITGQRNENGQPEIFVDVYFDEGVSHRFQSDDVLEYPRQSRTKKTDKD